MLLATPVDEHGQTAHSWGRAHWLALATLEEEDDGVLAITDWRVEEVAWDISHDAGTHGSHHARVIRFLLDNGVQAAVVDHVGTGMYRMLHSAGIATLPSTPGDARASVAKAYLAAKSAATDSLEEVVGN